jgi:hypothetical protein
MEAGFAAGAFLAVGNLPGNGPAPAWAIGPLPGKFREAFKIAICARVHKRLLCYLLR